MCVPVDSVGTRTLYFFADDIPANQAKEFGDVLLADTVVEEHDYLGDVPVYEQPIVPEGYRGSWKVRVGYKRKPLISDSWGDATKLALDIIFSTKLGPVRKIDEYEIFGNLTREQIGKICKEEKLADSKVQSYIVIPMGGNNV
ncbi:MAG: hypothetical protein JXC85_01525 [Candidatus Aenigmarchaeota archaeon]|nr:hypothetical protein [Candidatus Aenigmarchaeota archaeon]